MTFFDNYPPGPMTGRGGPNDDGCPCADCPGLNGGGCDCDLEVLDDLPFLPNPLCDDCGCCYEHCHCYDDGDEAAGDEAVEDEVEMGDVLDALDPERESGLDWDAGADVAPALAPIQRTGQNYWVTRDLTNPWPGEEGVYFEEQRRADLTPPMTCPNQHEAHFKPTVGTHVCQQCGLIYIGRTEQWVAPSR